MEILKPTDAVTAACALKGKKMHDLAKDMCKDTQSLKRSVNGKNILIDIAKELDYDLQFKCKKTGNTITI